MTLQTRPFGSTGIDVSVIGLGAWQLGRSASWPTGPDPDEAVRIVHAALDAGVNFLLANASVSTVIPGTRSVEHLQTSIAAAAEPLPAATVEAIQAWYADRLGERHLDW